MWNARLRLGALWISHVARVMADNCLRIYVALEFARLGDAQKVSAWHLVTLILMVPAVFFAPINGAICNGLSKQRVLLVSSIIPFIVVFAYCGSILPSILLCWDARTAQALR